MSADQPARKSSWKAPTIVRHTPGLLNKFGGLQPSFHLDAIDGVGIADLVKKHGSPLFVISETRLRETARRVQRAFTSRYPKVKLAWSYKTNYLGAVCRILHQEGFDAEVVSGFEYQKARTLGVPGSHIFFNGPYKTLDDLERAVREGARIHIDHFDELYALEEVARTLPIKTKLPVSIRLNFDTGFTPQWTRFGFNLENGQAMEAARRLAASPSLRLAGLHNHLGTFISDTRAYSTQDRVLADFMGIVEAATDCMIDTLDLGGGMASRNSLQGTYLTQVATYQATKTA